MILSEQHRMIRDLARKFAETELTADILDQVEETAVFPQEVLDKMAKVGFFGVKVPKSMGGQGGDTLAYMLVMEEICRVSAIAGIYVSSANSLSSGPIMMAGTPDQIEKYLKPVVTGTKRLCFALTEPGAGSSSSML